MGEPRFISSGEFAVTEILHWDGAEDSSSFSIHSSHMYIRVYPPPPCSSQSYLHWDGADILSIILLLFSSFKYQMLMAMRLPSISITLTPTIAFSVLTLLHIIIVALKLILILLIFFSTISSSSSSSSDENSLVYLMGTDPDSPGSRSVLMTIMIIG